MERKIGYRDLTIINLSKTIIFLKKCTFSKMANRNQVKFNILTYFESWFFVNRSIGSKVTTCVQMSNIYNALAPILAAKYELLNQCIAMDQFTKFNFLNRLESGTEHYSTHEYWIWLDFDLPFWKNYIFKGKLIVLLWSRGNLFFLTMTECTIYL